MLKDSKGLHYAEVPRKCAYIRNVSAVQPLIAPTPHTIYGTDHKRTWMFYRLPAPGRFWERQAWTGLSIPSNLHLECVGLNNNGAPLPLEFALVKLFWHRVRFEVFYSCRVYESSSILLSCCLVYSSHVKQESFTAIIWDKILKRRLLVIVIRALCVEDRDI